MRAKAKKEGLSVIAIVTIAILITYVVVLLIPVLWTLMTSLKPLTEFRFGDLTAEFLEPNKIGFPSKLTFENYVTAYNHFSIEVEVLIDGVIRKGKVRIFNQFLNSIMYAVGCGFTTTFTSLIMGYAVARFRYRFSNYIYMFVLITMALPIVGSMPSEIAVATSLGIFDTFPGIWIMRATFLNTYFLIFYAQFKMIPYDYTEAAKIDGASPLTTMFKIIVPLAMGTVSAVFVLNFIAYWNDYQIPMIYLESHPVAAYGMYYFDLSQEKALSYLPVKMAGIWILAAPVVVFYAIFNKKLTVNLSVGGIKG